jgi:hypothetical protein
VTDPDTDELVTPKAVKGDPEASLGIHGSHHGGGGGGGGGVGEDPHAEVAARSAALRCARLLQWVTSQET